MIHYNDTIIMIHTHTHTHTHHTHFIMILLSHTHTHCIMIIAECGMHKLIVFEKQITNYKRLYISS